MYSSISVTLITAIGLLLVFTTACISADNPTCAVLTFQPGTGCTADEAKFVSDRYAALLSQLGTHTVLARSEMEKIMTVQKWNMSDYCSATECAVEAGRMLSVQFVIFGTVGHVGRLYSMNTSLVEIESGKVTASAVTDFKGLMEDFVRGGPGQNIRSLLVVKQTPRDWSLLPPETPDIQPARTQPETKPIQFAKKDVYFSPRIGISTFTGTVGLEVQTGHFAWDVGSWITPYTGVAGGIRYYSQPHGNSLHVGLGADFMKWEGDELTYDFAQAGIMGGYQWRWQAGWQVSVGIGLAYQKQEKEEDGELSEETRAALMGELVVGFSL